MLMKRNNLLDYIADYILPDDVDKLCYIKLYISDEIYASSLDGVDITTDRFAKFLQERTALKFGLKRKHKIFNSVLTS